MMERPSVSNQCVVHVSSTNELMSGFLKSLNPLCTTKGVSSIGKSLNMMIQYEKAKTLAENLMKSSDSRIFIKQVENAPPNTYELEEEYSDSYEIFSKPTNCQGRGSFTRKYDTPQRKEVVAN